MRKILTVWLLLAVLFVPSFSLCNEFSFCPQGIFVDDSSAIQFERRASWSADYILRLSSTSSVNFTGPIFPGYKLPRSGKTEVDPKTRMIIDSQFCKEFDAKVTKTFSMVNGGILSQVSWDAAKAPDKDVSFRILMPLDVFAGIEGVCNGKAFSLPAQKSADYIICQGGKPADLRFRIKPDLDMGIKLLSGIKMYRVADCRHHGKPESQFHVSLTIEDNSFSYFLCLLKPDEPFPSIEEDTLNDDEATVKGNLLGEGSGFEVGPKNVIPYAYYSWSEAWTSPATQLPTFDMDEKCQGKYSLRLQADDMKKVRGRFNMNAAIFKRVKLDPQRTYTLSAWMKSDCEGMLAALECREGVWNGGAGKKVKVTTEWQRYTHTFKPEKYKLLNYCTTWVGIHPSMKEGRLWIDSVQLEEGEVSEYAPPAFEFGAAIDSKYKLFTPEELKDAAVTLTFRNNADEKKVCAVNYVVKDYWGKEVAKGTESVEVAAKSNSSAMVDLPELPFGYYRMSFDADNGKHRDEAIFGVYESPAVSGRLPLDWPLGCDASEGDPIVRKLGFGWTRSWDFTFKRVCPEPDKLNFEETDIVVERCRKAGLNIMPILGSGFGWAGWMKNGEHSFIPNWAIEKTLKSSKKGSWARKVSFPKIDAWKIYVKTVVSRYKDDIRAWEVLNEPNCWILPEEYVPYLQATYEAAKEADPTCLVVGGCATSDWGGEPAPWTKRVIELDQCKSMDVLSIHMYSNKMPELYKSEGSDKYLEALKGFIQDCGKSMPIWHSEKSHNTTNTGYSQWKHGVPPVYMKEPGFRVENFRQKAEFLLRETIIDSSVGKGPYFWFGNMPNDIRIASHRNPYGLQHIEYDNSPCPELVAANGFARMLSGREKPVELVKLGAYIYCALHEGEKGVLASVWNTDGDCKLKLPDTAGEFGVYNFFGVPVERKAADSVSVGTAPVYFTFDGVKAVAVKEIMAGADILGKRFTFVGGLEMDAGKPALAVYARNLTARNQTLNLGVSELPDGWAFEMSSIVADCRPQEYTRFVLPVSKMKKLEQPLAFKLVAGKQPVEISIPPLGDNAEVEDVLLASGKATAKQVAVGTVEIDGDLSDWNGVPCCGAATLGQVKSGRDQWKGAEDLSCKASFCWDEKYLYLAATIYDDVLERNVGVEKVYCSDGMEFFIGLDPEAAVHKSSAVSKTGEGDFQIFLAPALAQGKYNKAGGWCNNTKSDAGIIVGSKQTSYGYAIEAAIPWKSLATDFTPAKGKVLGMTFQIPDSDVKGSPASKKIFWTGNDGNWLNPNLWGRLVLR